ncbi:SDR family NAD(P)-dependent oxidoreductase [Paenibacillus sp. MBLB4367]|uniref:SDR family NAD(P)-dependent oxidoreductase n=1 Tax=Paenibacillus sp. MBLB4367 TaxID=3384767 RepID=UPI0039081E17
MRLDGKRVLVTGGAQDIGKAVVTRFLREGANVFVLDIREAELRRLQEEFFQ